MGYMRHHAIVVTSFDKDLFTVHARAKELVPGLVSDVVEGRINFYGSFLIAPDGSKEGWETSDEGEAQRQRFIDWLRASGAWAEWALVQYGDDNGESLVVDHSDAEEKEEASRG